MDEESQRWRDLFGDNFDRIKFNVNVKHLPMTGDR